MRKLLLLLPLFGLFACEPPTDGVVDHKFQDIVRKRASIEFMCGWEHIAVAPLGGWAYRAEGCSTVQIYECTIDATKYSSDATKILYVCQAQSSTPVQTTKPADPTCNDADGG